MAKGQRASELKGYIKGLEDEYGHALEILTIVRTNTDRLAHLIATIKQELIEELNAPNA